MHAFNRSLALFARLLLATLFLLWIASFSPAFAAENINDTTQASSSWSFPIRLFQKSISRADGDRCPMYPSCSHYAAKAFKKHGAIKGWILSCDRLLRCGHDEIRRSPMIRVNRKPRIFDPMEANTRWWSEDRGKK